MTERVIAWVVLLFSIYASVWSVNTNNDSLIPVFGFLSVMSIWTVLKLTDEAGEGFDSE